MSVENDPFPAAPETKGYIPILDGWRAVAILLVLIFHGFFNSEIHGRTLTTVATLSGKTGALGVLIFFCISGYLITKRLRMESVARGTVSLQVFYTKRIFRIIPPLALYLAMIGIFFLFGLISLGPKDWAAPLFLTNYIPGSWYVTHFWSLSLEEHFYFFWPACVVIVGWRRAMWVGVALVMAVGIWRPWELHHVNSQIQALRHTDMRLDYIMMGCVVALAVEFYPSTGRVLRVVGTGFGLFILTTALLLTTLPSPIDLRSIQAAILTLMVCGTSVANAPIPQLLLANPFMLFVGRISYSIYVWQQLILGPSNNLFLRSPWALPFKLGAAFLIGYLSYRFVERPAMEYGRKLVAERRKVQAGS